MDTPALVILIIIVLAAAGALAWLVWRKRRTQKLRGRFGPEYDRVVTEHGSDRGRAEAVLESRAKRVERLNIRPLTSRDRERYSEAWRAAQARFVDDPNAAVLEADQLVAEVMEARGYPVGNFEQRAADISVDHPRVVENYRSGHEIALRQQRGEASTEDLRQAMVYYRALFEQLLEAPEPAEVRR